MKNNEIGRNHSLISFGIRLFFAIRYIMSYNNEKKQWEIGMNIEQILENMTLEEKIALCSGADFWHTKEIKNHGIPSMMMSDGPHGLRKQPESADMLGINESVPAPSFPTASISACSWDQELLK